MKRRVLLLGVALFAVAAASIAGTASGRSAVRAYIGSAQIKNGSIQVADLSARARRSLRGQRGPRGFAGDPGPAGAQGPAGVAGPAGPAGVSGYEVVQTVVQQQTSSTQAATATCTGTKRVVGGGAATYLGGGSAETVPVALTQNGPFGTQTTGANGWAATAVAVNGYAGPWAMTVWAICGNVS